MNYQSTLNYLYSQLPVFQHEGKNAYKPGLDNTIRIANELGNPQQNYRCVHVAGTNGKGSVSHTLASVLQQAGYKVGLYTSPHLKDFRERIRVNGKCITQRYVCKFVAKHKAFFEEVQPSFFEATMCMAFHYFSDKKIDIAVVETGMGGRLDSTNIISPVLSVITNIGFDHQQFLGNTLAAIAAEKAGIIKPKTPVVIGEALPEIETVFRKKAQTEKAPIFFAEKELNCSLIHSDEKKQQFDCGRFGKLTLGLGGWYQQKNIATVLIAIEKLMENGFKISQKAIAKGVELVTETTGLQGRWQTLQTRPTIICDTGHNEHGICRVIEQLLSLPCRQLHVVIGMANDKDVDKILCLFPKNAVYYFCKASIPRALPEFELQQKAQTAGLHGNAYATVQEALDAAKNQALDDDIIFVGGSNFVVAEVL